MTEIVLVRHGQTQWNCEGRIQGHTDSPLTAEGVRQAKALAARLTGESFAAVYASDLGRAQHTAEILACGRWPIHLREALRERSFGVGEGLTYAEMEARYPLAFSRVNTMDPDYRMPQGESRADLHNRVCAAFGAMALAHPAARVLVVSHGGVLAAVYRWIKGMSIASPQAVEIPNVGYNRLRHADGAWSIAVWADVTHLAAATYADAV